MKSLVFFIVFAFLTVAKCAVNFETAHIDADYVQTLLNEYRNSKINPVKLKDNDIAKFKYLLSPKAVLHITDEVNSLHKVLPNIPNIPYTQENERVTVVGDLHGQFSTLLHVVTDANTGKLIIGNDESGMRNRYVFVGDYINREFDSMPVLVLIYAMKCAYPEDVFMIRGNHETTGNAQSIDNNLMLELKHRYSNSTNYNDIFGCLTKSFMYLPIGYVIENSILVVHAGFGPGPGKVFSIKELNAINRKSESPSGDFLSIINARPVDIRLGSTSYTVDQVRQFLDRENLKCLVRGHDSLPEGIQNLPAKGEAVCVTVHSASFCCPFKSPVWNKKNAGGYIHFYNRGPNIGRFDVFIGDVTSTTPESKGMNNPDYIKTLNARQNEQIIVKSVPKSASSTKSKSNHSSPLPHAPGASNSGKKSSWLLMGSFALIAVLMVAAISWKIYKDKTATDSL